MTTIRERGAGVLRAFVARFAVRRDNSPICSAAQLQHFLTSHSAFVAQHKLYGYLKTRMGTRYPSMFEDDVFIQSVNIAKMHVFVACLSDVTVHAVAKVTAGSGISSDERAAFAARLFRGGIAEYEGEAPKEGDTERWIAAFDARLGKVNWENVAAGWDAFTQSPDALVRWAPIAEELKRYDVEIVRNSVRYAWNEVIRTLRQRLDPEALRSELRATR